jgi:cation-transporting ATPase E
MQDQADSPYRAGGPGPGRRHRAGAPAAAAGEQLVLGPLAASGGGDRDQASALEPLNLLFRDLRSSPRGLASREAARRLQAYGPNELARRGRRQWPRELAAQFTHPLAILLAAAAVLAWASGTPRLAIAIAAVIGLNAAFAFVQELQAERAVEALAAYLPARARVLRDGEWREAEARELVPGDIVEVEEGEAISADARLVTGTVEVDMSTLTGESVPVERAAQAVDLSVPALQAPGVVFSGTVCTGGEAEALVTATGMHTELGRIAALTERVRREESPLEHQVKRVAWLIAFVAVGAGAAFLPAGLAAGLSLAAAVSFAIGLLVANVPEGLLPTITLALAVGVRDLARRGALVKRLSAVETLGSTTVVCTDKTGTLTENRMQIADVQRLDTAPDMRTIIDALASIAADDARPNASIQAVADAYRNRPGWAVTGTAPFKSATKWSGVSYAGHGNWVLGAPDVLLDPSSAVAKQADEAGSHGLRVLLLGYTDLPVDHPDAPGRVVPAALITLEQRIRPDARQTLDYFAAQRVSVKVISGDNAVSVGAVASAVGLSGAAVDARKLPTDPGELADSLEQYSAFGRVRPDQKRAIVQALQSRGNTVAMTGDGVNDVLALKDADIGVAMGSGSPAARAVAQIVLLDNRFATLPYVVAEGRRVIGNIERVSNLFLTKTVYSALLALLIGIGGLGARAFGINALAFPFQPIQVTTAAWFTIGIPAFILSLAPNNERAQPGFVRRVIIAAVPNGAVAGVATFVCYLLAFRGAAATPAQQMQASTSALITLLVVAGWVLAVVARPYTWWRLMLVSLSGAAYVVIFNIPLAREQFMLDPSNSALTATALGIGMLGAAIVEALWWLRGTPRRAA